MGDSLRTVQNWVNRFERMGTAGLREGHRPGRTPRLTEAQLAKIESTLRSTPEEHGLADHVWVGKTLSTFVLEEFEVELSIRQCQRMVRKNRSRYLKPRLKNATANPQSRASSIKAHRSRR